MNMVSLSVSSMKLNRNVHYLVYLCKTLDKILISLDCY